MSKAKTIITYFTIIVVGLYFFFLGLVEAKSFLAPLSVAALLSMVVLPVSQWLEGRGLNRGLAALLSDLLILLFFVGIGWVVALQVNSFAEDWPNIRQRIEPKLNQATQFVEDKTGLSLPQLPLGFGNENPKPPSGQEANQPNKTTSDISTGSPRSSFLSTAGGVALNFFNLLGAFLLTFIYIFFFLMYRSKFRKSILKMAPEDETGTTNTIITKALDISQNYLFGRLILITILAVLYSIGLSFSGVQHAILISVLAAVLTLIPYLGNVVGFSLAVGMAFVSGSGLPGVIGVTITFSIAQFVESYILEPYIVGDKVNLNPVFTIIIVILGAAIWGVIGMLIAIPALGIIKVILDQIPALRPLGYLFGNEDLGNDKKNENVFSKIKAWAKNKFGHS